MANPFDQFDVVERNPFDQFDAPLTNRKPSDIPWKSVNGKRVSTDPKVILSDYGRRAKPAPGLTYEEAGLQYVPATWEEIATEMKKSAMGALRGIGRVSKNVAQGVPALPGTIIDAPARIYEGLSGNQAPAALKPYQSYANALESPVLADRNAEERVSSDIQRGMASTLGSMGVGSALAGSTNMATRGIGQALQSNPGAQLTSSATGATASGVTREMGGGPIAQFAAGIAGGMVPQVVGSLANAAARTAKNMAQPLTRSGQEQMASDVLAKQATDKTAAAERLANADEIIPGSPRTMGEASQDPGLLALEKGLRNKDMSAFAPTISAQNSAQQQALGKIAGTPNDIRLAEAAREAETASMRESALANGGPVPIEKVTGKIDEILSSPVGKRQVISKALTEFRKQLDGETDPANLYEIRKDINDAMMGKLGGEKSVFSLARKELNTVKDSLDDAIESAAPGFKAYLSRYKELSKPINQMEALQEVQARSQLQSMDVLTREQFLGPSSFGKAVDAVLADPKTPLTPKQIETLKAIRTDLQYGQAINSRLIKPAGSDTFQNLSIAQVLGAGETSVHPALRIVAKPLSWLYKVAGTDESVNEILKSAATDPKLAATLLSRATPVSVTKFSESLRIKAMAGALGSQAQIAAMQSRWSEDRSTQPEDRSGN